MIDNLGILCEISSQINATIWKKIIQICNSKYLLIIQYDNQAYGVKDILVSTCIQYQPYDIDDILYRDDVSEIQLTGK